MDGGYDDDHDDEWEPTGNPRRVLILRLIALFLVIALVLPLVYAFVRDVLGG